MTLLISAVGCDRRKTIYKTLEKFGEVQFFDAPEEARGHGDEEIAAFIQGKLRGERKTMKPGRLRRFANSSRPICARLRTNWRNFVSTSANAPRSQRRMYGRFAPHRGRP